MLGYVLTVFFACTSDCGQPAQFTAQTFQTYSQCVAAGGLWLSPNANPDQAVVTYQCNGTTVAVSPTVTPSNPPPVAPPSKPWTAPVADTSGGRGLPTTVVTSPVQPPAAAPLLLYRRPHHQTRHRWQVLLAMRGEISSLQTTHRQLSNAEQGFDSQFCVF